MQMTGKKVGTLAAFLMCGALAMPVLGQAAPGGTDATTGGAAGGAGGAGGGNGANGANGGANRGAQFRQRMMDNLKTRLGATDDEFAAIQPKIEKVMDLQRDAQGAGMRGLMGGGGRGNRNGGGGGNGAAQPAAAVAGAEQTPVQKASADLQTALDNKDATPDDIKTKLDALRDAKTKAKTDLEAAQKDLEGVLTQRQEAVLVMMGLLN
jgi:hypothetical protein